MLHLLHLLKSIFYTIVIVAIPPLIITGGIPHSWLSHPVYQFFVLLVFSYAAAPVISDFAGNHVGKSLFFPNRANLDHPTLSHIITLRNKRLYNEALEELRMLTDLYPKELEPYKMLLHLTANELPDRRLFDMFFRKGMFNLEDDESKIFLQRYRDEHVQHKDSQEEEWRECSHEETHEQQHERHFFANKSHTKGKSKIIVNEQHGTLPPRTYAEVNVPAKGKSPKRAVLLTSHFQDDIISTEQSSKETTATNVVKKKLRTKKETTSKTVITQSDIPFTPESAGDIISPIPKEKPLHEYTYVFRRNPRK